MRAAAEALQTLATDRLDGKWGVMAVPHTWGRNLTWHPHLRPSSTGIMPRLRLA
jgi:hypothetical protein